jgi:hypothetical protein
MLILSLQRIRPNDEGDDNSKKEIIIEFKLKEFEKKNSFFYAGT